MGHFASVGTAVLLLCCAFGHAQLHEGDACLTDDGGLGVCTTIANCTGTRRRLNRGLNPETCSFATSVCCSPTSLAVTKMPASPPTTVTVRTNVSLVDRNTIAGRKCEEYVQYVFRKMSSPTLLIGEEETYTMDECAMLGETQIVGGKAALPKEFPHMAAVGYEIGNNTVWNCGGSLISERFVLTVAHCVPANTNVVMWVRLGDLDLYNDTDAARPVTLAVAERIKHEENNGYINDIALLKLERDVTFSPYIRPACMYTRPGNPPGKLNATACGWGRLEYNTFKQTINGCTILSDNDMKSAALLKVDLTFRPESVCHGAFPTERNGTRVTGGFIPESMICAGDPKGMANTLKGDSGGPLQIRLTRPDPYCMYSIIGLTSFGVDTCSEGENPAIYTRISHFIPWIERHVWP